MTNPCDKIPSWGIEVFGLLFCWGFGLPLAIWQMNSLVETDCMTGEEFACGVLLLIVSFGGAHFLQCLSVRLWKNFKNRKQRRNV